VILFFDTSVLVAVSVLEHPHHRQALAAFRLSEEGNGIWTSQHTVAELYAALTGLPLNPRIHPADALQIIEQDLLSQVGIVALEPEDYRFVVRDIAAKGWRSGRIYDALHLRCAQKKAADRIYTFNWRHFQELAPAELQPKICIPE
jgi:predicted nucleic acid-binding protein